VMTGSDGGVVFCLLDVALVFFPVYNGVTS
jgi:hypothetical protein